MTEQEWLVATNPRKMLAYLKSRASDRKVRLFACACCRRVWSHVLPPSVQELVEVAEQYAEGAVDAAGLSAALQATIDGGEQELFWGQASFAACWAANEQRSFVERVSSQLAREIARHEANARSGNRWKAAKDLQLAAQARLVRDLFGNPFYPVALDPAWLTPTVTDLATVAYNERALPSGELEVARLAVLADALEEAGCTNGDILSHLRSPGRHVRGCWAVDLLLGKE
jgi:hypothetical protein